MSAGDFLRKFTRAISSVHAAHIRAASTRLELFSAISATENRSGRNFSRVQSPPEAKMS